MGEKTEFLAKFLPLYFIPFFLAARVIPLEWLTNIIAAIESSLLTILGTPNTLSASNIFTSNVQFIIVPECTGLSMVILLFALLYATKINENKKLNALKVYTPILLLFNIFRLFLVLWLGSNYGNSTLNYAHPAFWFVDAGIVFAIWFKTINENPGKKGVQTS